MSQLVYVQGDATQPTPLSDKGDVAIFGPHCVNDAGGWGSGYVVALTNRFGDSPSGVYKLWHKGATTQQVNERLKERNKPNDVKLLHQTKFVLGGIQILAVPDTTPDPDNRGYDYNLVNMIGQHNYNPQGERFLATHESRKSGIQRQSTKSGIERPPIRYGAMAKAMYNLAEYIRKAHASPEQGHAEIHCPKFGSDLAGGKWEIIESLILELWVDQGIPVCVYEWVPKV